MRSRYFCLSSCLLGDARKRCLERKKNPCNLIFPHENVMCASGKPHHLRTVGKKKTYIFDNLIQISCINVIWLKIWDMFDSPLKIQIKLMYLAHKYITCNFPNIRKSLIKRILLNNKMPRCDSNRLKINLVIASQVAFELNNTKHISLLIIF